jgi:hypothetical protein
VKLIEKQILYEEIEKVIDGFFFKIFACGQSSRQTRRRSKIRRRPALDSEFQPAATNPEPFCKIGGL